MQHTTQLNMFSENISELCIITHHDIYVAKSLFQDAQLGIPQFQDHKRIPRFTPNISNMQLNAMKNM